MANITETPQIQSAEEFVILEGKDFKKDGIYQFQSISALRHFLEKYEDSQKLKSINYIIRKWIEILNNMKENRKLTFDVNSDAENRVIDEYIATVAAIIRDLKDNGMQNQTYDQYVYWREVVSLLNEYRDIVAPGCKEDLFLSDFIAMQLHKKFGPGK